MGDRRERIVQSQCPDPLSRRPEITRAVMRGAARHLMRMGHGVVTEIPLPNGRRADIMALSKRGLLLIVEIKSCLSDFRGDLKWPDYRDYCDGLYFAVPEDFPGDLLPADAGVILADRFGATIIRDSVAHALSGARRKQMTIAFGRHAARRLQDHLDPMGADGTSPG